MPISKFKVELIAPEWVTLATISAFRLPPYTATSFLPSIASTQIVFVPYAGTARAIYADQTGVLEFTAYDFSSNTVTFPDDPYPAGIRVYGTVNGGGCRIKISAEVYGAWYVVHDTDVSGTYYTGNTFTLFSLNWAGVPTEPPDVDVYSAAPSPLGAPAIRGAVDWASSLGVDAGQDIYLLDVIAPGYDAIRIPISSWQATYNGGDSASFVQAVVPGVMDWIDALTDRANGTLIISGGKKFADGMIQVEEVIRASFDDARIDRGPFRATGTLSGYSNLNASGVGTRMLRNVRQKSTQGGKRRVSCELDLFLLPGMTVTDGEDTFIVGYINYFVNGTGKTCQVGER